MHAMHTAPPTAEHRRVYDLIWSQMPHLQNRMSSAWWFFILFPRESEGYGPRQLMFSIATRAGREIRICGTPLPGLDVRRRVIGGVDRFPAMAVGWYCDGQRVHENVVKETAVTTLSAPDRFIRCRSDDGFGYEIRASETRPLALEAQIHGRGGSAQFTAWGALNSLHASPHESLNIATPLGGTHFIAWRRMQFEGEFDLPTGRERLSGITYFQRVCLNVPTFPWKWIWALFPDGTMFSAYVPYVGRNLLRRGYRFFESNRAEQTAVSILPAAFWDWPGASDQVLFSNARVTPILGRGPHPHFLVQVSNRGGDWLSFIAEPYGHANLDIDRPVLGGRFETHWNYNEYMFRMQQLVGRVGGRPITHATLGQGFGSLEYTWGLGL